MRKLTLAFALLGTLTLAGCPKGSGGGTAVTYDEETLATNPAANFHKGLSIVQTPDKKTGEVNYAEAYSYFAKAADLGGGAKASFNAGWTAERLGKIAEAEGHYRKAYETDASYEPAANSLARILTEQGKHAEAAEIYAAAADGSPDNLTARNEYMAALVRAGTYDTAIAEAQGILRKDPKNAEAYRNLSALYYTQDNYSMSQLTAQKALELDDSDPGVYNNLGVTYLIQSDEPQAIDNFKTAIKLDSGHFEANMNLGFTSLNSGDYQLALSCFEAATASNPASLDAKLGLAVAIRGTGDFKRAGQIYDEIIANDAMYDAAYFNAAVLHEFYTKDFAKALKYLQAFIDSHNVGPTHEVFGLMARVNEAKAAEDEKKRIEAEKKRAAEERERRNKELLGTIADKVAATESKLTQYGECIDAGSAEEVMMVLEQAMMIVEAEEADMAPDVDGLLDAYIDALDAAVANCEPSAPAEEAPAEDAPAEDAGGEEAPAEEAPAEDTGGEEAPAEEAPAEEGGG